MSNEAVENIEKLVAEVAKMAATAETDLHGKIAALKVLASYYAAMKGKPKDSSDESGNDDLTMDDLARRLSDANREPEDAGNGFTTARSRN